ncbi:MAG: MerR family DNA-binding transcriptional regulator [Rhodobacteraceae bacterium]|uniref:MerR family DNA-binding transcriptional regulator n=1 Tax=Marivita sp. TaxID=2003365 RepID=UPI003B5213B7|nr:MerR family DNA-binding transcriptional regulator [Paracoccaceae bacterium]
MNIREGAQSAGLPPKTIRYYVDIGLVRPQGSKNGYRAFRETGLHKFAFLGRARALGASIEEGRTLLGLYEDESRESALVKAIATVDKIGQLQPVRKTLSHLVSSCHGDDRLDCSILSDLAGGPA